MDNTISAHRLAHLLLEMPDLPVMVHVITDPSTFQAFVQEGRMTWDADDELCTLDPDDVVEKEGAIYMVVELKDWDEEMDSLGEQNTADYDSGTAEGPSV